MWFNEGSGNFLGPTTPVLRNFFLEKNFSNCAVFWAKWIYRYKRILSNFSSQNKDFIKPLKSTKNIVWVKWLQHIFNKSSKHSNINIAQDFGYVQNKIMFYEPGIHNLQTRTVSFPDQEKLLEKADGG